MNTLQEIFIWVITFINQILVPLAFALAFVMFLFGVYRYFFTLGINVDEKRLEGKKFIMWGIVAIAVMFAVWGLVNILLKTFSLENSPRPCLPTFSGKCNPGDPGGSPSNRTPQNILPPAFDTKSTDPRPSGEPKIPGTGLDGIY